MAEREKLRGTRENSSSPPSSAVEGGLKCECCDCCLRRVGGASFLRSSLEVLDSVVGADKCQAEVEVNSLVNRIALALKTVSRITPSALVKRQEEALQRQLSELCLKTPPAEETQGNERMEECTYTAADDLLVEKIEPLFCRLQQRLISTQVQIEARLEEAETDSHSGEETHDCESQCHRPCEEGDGNGEGKNRGVEAASGCPCRDSALQAMRLIQRDCAFKLAMLHEVIRVLRLAAAGHESNVPRVFSVAKAARLVWSLRPFLSEAEMLLPRLKTHCQKQHAANSLQGLASAKRR